MIIVVLVTIIGLRASSSRPVVLGGYHEGATPWVIAHRGGALERPENTLLAFAHAVQLGVDVLEMDLHASADGEIVVIHDASVERTTNDRGLVREHTLEQLQQMDAAYHWVPVVNTQQGDLPASGEPVSYRGQGVRIPTLRQVLRRFPSTRMNLEIKQSKPPLAQPLCELLREEKATARTLVVTSVRSVAKDFRQACAEVPTGAHQIEAMSFVLHYKLGMPGLYQPIAHAMQLPLAAYGVNLADPDLYAAAARRGMRTDVWTINDAATMREVMANGASSVMTDRPTLALEVRSEVQSEVQSEVRKETRP